MLRKDLTVETGLKEVGTVLERQRQRLGPESPYTLACRALVARFSKAVDEGEMERWSDRSWNPTNKCREETHEELRLLARHFRDHERPIIDHTNVYPIDSESSDDQRKLFELQYQILPQPRREAVLNALEHGTDFAEKSNVIIETIYGSKGILSFVSQRTAGITRERIEQLLAEKNPYSTLYWAKNKAGPEKRIRGGGFTDFRLAEKVDVGFEPYTSETRRFRTVILGTLKSYDRIREGYI